MKKTAKIIGIGNAGMKIVEKLKPQGCYGNTLYSTIGLSTHVEDLENTSIPEKIRIGFLTCRDLESNGDVDLGRAALAEQLGIVIERIGNPDYILIVAGFGSGTSAGATIELAETLDKLEMPAVCLVIKPFEFEGKRKLNNFYDGMLDSMVNNVTKYIFDSDELIKPNIPKKLTIQKAFKTIDEIILKRIKNVLSKNGL